MPNIRQVEAPQGIGLNPTETGISTVAGNARRMGAYGSQIADTYTQMGNEVRSTVADVGKVADDYMTHRDISAGAANGAQLIANLNDQWNETAKNADPNDVTVKDKFLEEKLKPTLDNFKEGFSTERSGQWAEHFVDQYRQHMFEKTSSDMSTLAGIAVRKNVATTVNSLSSAVASDPSSLDFALSSVDHSIGETVRSSPNLSATQAAEVSSEVGLKAKESIVKSAISGMIQKNPNLDLDAIQKKYGDYINGAEMKMFQRAAQTQAKVDAYHDKSAALAQKQMDDLQVHNGATKVITNNVSVDQSTGKPIINPKFFNDVLEIARKNPNAPSAAATVRTMLDWGESQLNKEQKIVDDPAVRQDLTDRLFDPDHPTTRLDLMKAQTAGKLSDHSFQSMERLVTELETTPLKGPIWETTAAAVKDALIVSVPGLPGKDSVGTKNYSTFMQTFLPQYIAKSRAGTLPPNALDTKDPGSMISQAMAPFKRTQAQRMSDYVGAAGGVGATPEKRDDAMPAIPPPDQRSPGLYETPRGKMRWTGTGWVAP